jgi:hypothetical protein
MAVAVAVACACACAHRKVEERAGHVAGESEEQAWREADGATSWQQAWANLGADTLLVVPL